MTTTIGFPGLGIEPFTLNRTVLSVGNITVYWYAVIICTGIILGFLTAYLRMKKLGVTLDNLADIVLVCVPSAIVGARLYYVLTSLEKYDSFLEMIAIWNGGIAIYGAVIAGVIAFTVYCLVAKKPLLKMYDCASPGLILGQIIGRWGNFVNGEAYGICDSYSFFGKTLDISELSRNNPLRMSVNGILTHPTFLYESLWNLAGFVFMNVFFRKKAFDGEVFLWYITWYGLGRCLIEGLRGDSLYVGNIRISQLVAFVCFFAGLITVVVLRIRKHYERNKENGNNN